MELVCLLYIQETLISPVYLPHKYSYVITLPNTFRHVSFLYYEQLLH